MKTVIKNKLYLGISAGLALVLLSGCGGGSGSGVSPDNTVQVGGGGGGSSGGGSGVSADPAEQYGEDTYNKIRSTDSITGGESVYQSSAHEGGDPTTDGFSISVGVEGDTSTTDVTLVFDTVYESEAGGFTVELRSSQFDTSPPESPTLTLGSQTLPGFSTYEYETDEYYIEYFNNVSLVNNGDQTDITMTVSTDWLSGGTWIYWGQEVGDVDLGAFVQSDTPYDEEDIAALEGEATYLGAAYGYYVEWGEGVEELGYSQLHGDFNGDVSLVADFGDGTGLGSISGEVNNLEYRFWIHEEEDRAYTSVDGSINLGMATIQYKGTVDDDSHGGFFRGDTEGTLGEYTFTGAWGGEFVGDGVDDGTAASDYPAFAAGTFSGGCFEEDGVDNGCSEDEYEAGFVGIFVTGNQE